MSRTTFLIFFTAFVLSASIFSTELRVPQDYLDLQSALTASADSDHIVLDTGTFSGPGFSSLLVPMSKNLHIRSVAGANYTKIIRSSGGTFLTCDNQSGTGRKVRIEGIAIQGFNRAVVFRSYTGAEIFNCIFRFNNAALSDSGADSPYWATIDSCLFDQNGVGVQTNGWTWLTLHRSQFINGGTGVYWVCIEIGELSNCSFRNNLTAIVLKNPCSTIERNDISQNWIGVACDGYHMSQLDLAQHFKGNNVWGNFDADYWNCDPVTGVACNISRNPAYCSSDPLETQVSSISPLLTLNNPCGVPIGYFEGIACYCGDVDVSGNVDIGDISAIISFLYLSGPAPTPPAAGEIDGISPIDIADLSRLIDYLYISFQPLPCGT